MRICIYIYIYTYTYVCIHTHICIHTYIYIYIHTHTRIHIYIIDIIVFYSSRSVSVIRIILPHLVCPSSQHGVSVWHGQSSDHYAASVRPGQGPRPGEPVGRGPGRGALLAAPAPQGRGREPHRNHAHAVGGRVGEDAGEEAAGGCRRQVEAEGEEAARGEGRCGHARVVGRRVGCLCPAPEGAGGAGGGEDWRRQAEAEGEEAARGEAGRAAAAQGAPPPARSRCMPGVLVRGTEEKAMRGAPVDCALHPAEDHHCRPVVERLVGEGHTGARGEDGRREDGPRETERDGDSETEIQRELNNQSLGEPACATRLRRASRQCT